MKVTNDKTENSQTFLTIEMEPAEVEESLQESYSRLVRKTNIPGFRKGKAPRDILERHIGKEALMEDTLQHLIPRAYEKAINEQKREKPLSSIIAHVRILVFTLSPIFPMVE